MPYAKILLAGHSGSGKTFTAARADSPFVLLFEPQGELACHAGYQSGERAGLPLEVHHCSVDSNGLKSALDSLALLSAPRTIVVDSLSAVQQSIVRSIAQGKSGSDPAAKMRTLTLPEWDLATKWLLNWLDRVLSVAHDVLVIVHAQRPESLLGSQLVLEPSLEGKRVNDFLHQRFTAVGLLHPIFDRTTRSTERVVVFDPAVELDGRLFRAKPGPGLRSVETPNPHLWISNMRRSVTGHDPSGPVPKIKISPLPAPQKVIARLP
jgi:hypothetical protein